MSKLIVLLLISITTSLGISAQTMSRYSKESISNEYSTYITELRSFVSTLENVPNNYNPQNLNDYEDYLGENASTSIQNLNDAFGNLISYLYEYDTYHGNGSLQSFFDSELDDVEEMPDCFSSWYNTEVSITVTAVAFCFTGVGCPACLAVGVAGSVANMGIYEDCMKQYNDNP